MILMFIQEETFEKQNTINEDKKDEDIGFGRPKPLANQKKK